jgi:hypothetical protein
LIKSIVTQSIQKIRLSKGGYDYTFCVGFVRARLGFGLIPMLSICIVVNLFANRRLVSGREAEVLTLCMAHRIVGAPRIPSGAGTNF